VVARVLLCSFLLAQVKRAHPQLSMKIARAQVQYKLHTYVKHIGPDLINRAN